MDITDTHAHGLAGHDLRLLRDQCRGASEGAFRLVRESDPVTTAKGARRRIAAIGRGLARTAWAHRARTDRRGTYAAWLAPEATAESIAVCCVSLHMHAGALTQLRKWPWMIVPRHAIARGHQRLGDADWAAVQSELRIVAVHAAAVTLLSKALGLKQFAIPAIHGLLIGDVDEDALIARTFLVPPFSKRWGAVLDAWLRFEQRGSPEWTRAIEDIALDHLTSPLVDALETLSAELSGPGFEFLRRAHEPGPDVVGDLWEAARAQQARDGARNA